MYYFIQKQLFISTENFDLFLGRVDEKAAQLHAIANLQNILHKSGGGPAPPANNSGSVPVPEVWHVMFKKSQHRCHKLTWIMDTWSLAVDIQHYCIDTKESA